MRFWQLLSIVDDRSVLRRVAAERREWTHIDQWVEDLERLVEQQDRAKLDFGLPREFIRHCLRLDPKNVFLSRDRVLRSGKDSFWDKKLSLVDAYDRFGADALFEALDSGSYTLPPA
jgi:hypothetical protein